jgi:hypothetical protein
MEVAGVDPTGLDILSRPSGPGKALSAPSLAPRPQFVLIDSDELWSAFPFNSRHHL